MERAGSPDWLRSVASSNPLIDAVVRRVDLGEDPLGRVPYGGEKRRYRCTLTAPSSLVSGDRELGELHFGENVPKVFVSLTRKLRIQATPSSLLFSVEQAPEYSSKSVILVSTSGEPLGVIRAAGHAAWLAVAHERISDQVHRIKVSIDRSKLPAGSKSVSDTVHIFSGSSDTLSLVVPVVVNGF